MKTTTTPDETTLSSSPYTTDRNRFSTTTGTESSTMQQTTTDQPDPPVTNLPLDNSTITLQVTTLGTCKLLFVHTSLYSILYGFFVCIVLFLSTTDTYNETTNSTAEDLPYQSGKCKRPILRNPFKGAGLPWPF